MLNMIFKFYMQSLEYEFFVRRLKNVSKTTETPAKYEAVKLEARPIQMETTPTRVSTNPILVSATPIRVSRKGDESILTN